MKDWQPIETAPWPKDLSEVCEYRPEWLVCTNRGFVMAGFAHCNGWVYGNTKHSREETGYRSCFPGRSDATYSESSFIPKTDERIVYWMPLPDPPDTTRTS